MAMGSEREGGTVCVWQDMPFGVGMQIFYAVPLFFCIFLFFAALLRGN